jgi:hypothetical protein
MKKKSTIVLVSILVALIIIYFGFVRKPANNTPDLTSSADVSNPASDAAANVSDSFLSTLLNVQSIKLDDSVFSDPAFATLRDSTIILIPDSNPGRSNPFAPIGSDITSAPAGSPASAAPAPGASTGTSGGAGSAPASGGAATGN